MLSKAAIALAASLALLTPAIAVGDKRDDMSALAQIENFETALETFREDVGRLPSTEEGLESLHQRPAGLVAWDGPYLKTAIPTDSWGQPYVYLQPPRYGSKTFDLYSLGRDGLDDFGGHDDITNWSGIPRELYPRPVRWEAAAVVAVGLAIIATLCFGLMRGARALRRKWTARPTSR